MYPICICHIWSYHLFYKRGSPPYLKSGISHLKIHFFTFSIPSWTLFLLPISLPVDQHVWSLSPILLFLVYNPSAGLPPEFITVSHLELPNVFPCVNILSKHSHLCSLSILSFWTQFTFNSIASLWDSFQPCLLLQVQTLIIISCIFFWVKKKLNEFDNKIFKKRTNLGWETSKAGSIGITGSDWCRRQHKQESHLHRERTERPR